jgi:Fe-S-cluster containining protein
MKVLTDVELDVEKGRITLFRGKCIDELPNCEAMCCRICSTVIPTSAELQSGGYEISKICLLTEKECEKEVEICINREHRLKKRPDGSCIYLDEDSRCSIYENQPQMCRTFFCRGGWHLAGTFPEDERAETTPIKMERADFVARVRDDMTFVPHPLLKLHTVFYAKAKEQITFLKEMVGTCGRFYTRDSFQYPQLDDDLLLRLIHLFDSKDTLQEIRQRFCDRHGVNLTKGEFYEIVWLLNKHQIVLESRNLGALLSGLGGI